MRIRKGVEDFLSAVTATVPRMEAVQFLRRYSRRGRAVTHYRTYGRSYDAVRKLLDRIGLVEGEDYTVKVSEYDKLTRQIHWNQTDRVRRLIDAATTFCDGVDGLAALVAAGTPAADIIASGVLGSLPVGEDETPVDPTKTLGIDFYKRNVELHKAIVDYYDDHDTEGLAFTDGFEAEVESDLEWESAVLPPDRLETMLQIDRKAMDRIRAKFPDIPKQLVFQHKPYCGRTLFRFLRKGEKVIGADLMLSTCVMDLMRETRPENPLRGYLGVNSTQAPSDMAKKYAVFVRADVPVHSAESLAWISADYPRFFAYVAELYRIAYGDELKVSFHKASRIGAPNNAMPHPTGETHGLGSTISSCIQGEGIAVDGSSVAAMLEFVITRDDHVDPLEGFVAESNRPVEIVHDIPASIRESLYRETNFDEADTPVEWFAIAHGVGIGPQPVGANIRRRERNLATLRDQLDLSDRAAVDSAIKRCSFEKDNRGIFSNPDQEFNPVSAFYSGVIAAFRYRIQKPKKSEKPGRPDGPEALHREQGLITAVYSGVTTDQSGVMGDGTPEFPVLGYAYESSIRGTEYDPTAKERFTKAISDISRTGAQLLMKERSKASVNRKHWIVIETNVDGPEFVRNAPDIEHFRSDIANTFLRCMALRVRDPRCSVDASSRTRAFGHVRGSSVNDAICHDDYGFGDIPSWTPRVDLEMAFGHKKPIACSQIPACDGSEEWFEKNGIDVGLALDTADRLYVIVTVEGDVAQWIRFSHRYDAALPVRSADLLRRVAPSGRPVEPVGDGRIYVNRSYDRNSAAVTAVWNLIVGRSEFSWNGEDDIKDAARPTFGPLITRERLDIVTSGPIGRDRLIDGGAFA